MDISEIEKIKAQFYNEHAYDITAKYECLVGMGLGEDLYIDKSILFLNGYDSYRHYLSDSKTLVFKPKVVGKCLLIKFRWKTQYVLESKYSDDKPEFFYIDTDFPRFIIRETVIFECVWQSVAAFYAGKSYECINASVTESSEIPWENTRLTARALKSMFVLEDSWKIREWAEEFIENSNYKIGLDIYPQPLRNLIQLQLKEYINAIENQKKREKKWEEEEKFRKLQQEKELINKRRSYNLSDEDGNPFFSTQDGFLGDKFKKGVIICRARMDNGGGHYGKAYASYYLFQKVIDKLSEEGKEFISLQGIFAGKRTSNNYVSFCMTECVFTPCSANEGRQLIIATAGKCGVYLKSKSEAIIYTNLNGWHVFSETLRFQK